MINFKKFNNVISLTSYFNSDAKFKLEKPRAFDPRGQSDVAP